MTRGRWAALVLYIGALTGYALADEGFHGQLVGSQPGEHVAGVASGGAPWVVANSEFNLSSNGMIQAEVRGPLISSGSSVNTVGPVTMVSASLVCGDIVATTTGAVPLSSTGDFSIHDSITVPTQCIAPAILIRIAETTSGPVTGGAFIAINGITNGSTPGGKGGHRP